MIILTSLSNWLDLAYDKKILSNWLCGALQALVLHVEIEALRTSGHTCRKGTVGLVDSEHFAEAGPAGALRESEREGQECERKREGRKTRSYTYVVTDK